MRNTTMAGLLIDSNTLHTNFGSNAEWRRDFSPTTISNISDFFEVNQISDINFPGKEVLLVPMAQAGIYRLVRPGGLPDQPPIKETPEMNVVVVRPTS